MGVDYLADYKNYLTSEKHSSPNTVSSYLRDISQFDEYLRKNQSCSLPAAKSEMVQDYIDWITEHGKSASSATRFLASIKSFYNYMIVVDAVQANPAKGVSTVKVERKYPEVLTNKEVELFLEQPQCVDAKGFRDHAMLELLYATGIRVSELISLNLDDVNLAAGFVHCESKGRERIIPLYHTAVKALQDYIRNIRPQIIVAEEEEALFVNMSSAAITGSS